MTLLSMDLGIDGYSLLWTKFWRTLDFRGWIPTNSQVGHEFRTCSMDTQWMPIWQVGPTWQWHMSYNRPTTNRSLCIDHIGGVICSCHVCKTVNLYCLLCSVRFYHCCWCWHILQRFYGHCFQWVWVWIMFVTHESSHGWAIDDHEDMGMDLVQLYPSKPAPLPSLGTIGNPFALPSS